MCGCRPKPETLKRRFTERKATQQRGVRGGARFESSNGRSLPAAQGSPSKSATAAKPKFGGSSTYSKTGPSSINSGRPGRFGKPSAGQSKPSSFGRSGEADGDNNSRPSKFGGSKADGFGRPAGSSGDGNSRPSRFGGSSFDKGKSSRFGKSAGKFSGPQGRSSGSAKFGQSSGGRPGKKRGLGAHKSFK